MTTLDRVTLTEVQALEFQNNDFVVKVDLSRMISAHKFRVAENHLDLGVMITGNFTEVKEQLIAARTLGVQLFNCTGAANGDIDFIVCNPRVVALDLDCSIPNTQPVELTMRYDIVL